MSNGIVVGSGRGGKWREWVSWRLVGLSAVAVLIAGSAGVGLRWWQTRESRAQEAARQAVIQQTEDVQHAALGGDTDTAHRTVQDSLKDPGLSDDARYALLIQDGVVYENEGKYDEAISRYTEAGKVDDTQAVAEAIARTAEAKGDTQMAITYYKKAITLIPSDYPLRETDKKLYEEAVERLSKEL